MSKQVVTSGQDYVVTQLDRSYGGREKEVLRVNGEDGSVTYSADVDIKGALTINGRPISSAPPSGSWTTVTDTLGRPMRLSASPANDIRLFVNGLLQNSTDYTLTSDGFVVWKSQDFTIAPSDKVEAVYET